MMEFKHAPALSFFLVLDYQSNTTNPGFGLLLLTLIFCICNGLPENCQCIIDRTHSKQCYDQTILDSDEQSVIKSASSLSLSDTRSDYISSDLSEGLSLSDSSEDNKPSRKTESLESSNSSCSPMYHKISNNAFDIHGEKVINEKLGSFDEANFSNGIIQFSAE